MDVEQLQITFLNLVNALLIEGILDHHFNKLPHGICGNGVSLAIEVITEYLGNSELTIHNYFPNALEQPVVDYEQLTEKAHQMKGSSSWIGVQKVRDGYEEFKSCCKDKNLEGCLRCLDKLKHDFATAKDILQQLVKLELDILEAGGKIPPLN